MKDRLIEYFLLSVYTFIVFKELFQPGIRQRMIKQINFTISPQVADLVKIIMENIDKAVDTTSLTGILGIAIILFTASVVFHQLRYSFNLIFNF